MKKHKIAVALVCGVFFTVARGAIAQTDEEQIALIPTEWYAPDDYLPGYYKPGFSILYFSPNARYSDYDNRGTGPFNGGVGVPEPGTLLLLVTGCLGVLLMVWRGKAAVMCDMLKHNLRG